MVAFCSSSPCSVRPVVLLMSAVAFICPFLGGGWRQDLQGRMSATAGGSVLGFFFFSVLGGWSGHGTTASVAPAVQGLLGGQCWPAGAEGAAARPPPQVLPLHRGQPGKDRHGRRRVPSWARDVCLHLSCPWLRGESDRCRLLGVPGGAEGVVSQGERQPREMKRPAAERRREEGAGMTRERAILVILLPSDECLGSKDSLVGRHHWRVTYSPP